MTIILRFDGLYRPLTASRQPACAGLMCYGWIVTRGGMLIGRGHGGYVRAADANSHIAEFLGLIEGLEALADMHFEDQRVIIIGDARSVIDQMRGTAAVNAEQVQPFYRRAQRSAERFSRLTWEWAPRSTNQAADALTRRALRQIRANPQSYLEILNQKHARFFPVLDLRVFQSSGLAFV